MKILFFTKNGNLLLVDKTTNKRKKIDNLQYYLDCPVLFEEGILFETFFNHIVKEKEFLNKVFKETMGDSTIDNFLEEWDKPSKAFIKNKGIQSIKSYKIFDCVEFPTEECFVDIRIDFDGIGSSEEIYNLEFIPLNHLKKIPFILSNQLMTQKTISILKSENLFHKATTFILLFELIGSVLYILTIHNNPIKRESAKHKFIKILKETNLIEILNKEKNKSISQENYEEAAYYKRMVDRLSNEFIMD
tara:strand:+ start:227 stop:967 length:741 start_codon:yes stop_codon:yes gene_type:complete